MLKVHPLLGGAPPLRSAQGHLEPIQPSQRVFDPPSQSPESVGVSPRLRTTSNSLIGGAHSLFTPASAASGKRKSEDSSSATNYFLQAKEAKQKQNNADLEKRKAEMKAKSDLTMKENKKKQDRKKELDKIQGDDNFEHFKAHYEEDDAVFDTKKAVEDESYFTELKTCYGNWKENIEPELMQEAADEEEDDNNLSTWSADKQMELFQQIADLTPDEQIEQLQEYPAIVNSEKSIENFAAWLANGSDKTTDADREDKPFPGISEINGEAFDPETFTMTTEFLPVWFAFAQNVYPEDYEDLTLTYKD